MRKIIANAFKLSYFLDELGVVDLSSTKEKDLSSATEESGRELICATALVSGIKAIIDNWELILSSPISNDKKYAKSLLERILGNTSELLTWFDEDSPHVFLSWCHGSNRFISTEFNSTPSLELKNKYTRTLKKLVLITKLLGLWPQVDLRESENWQKVLKKQILLLNKEINILLEICSNKNYFTIGIAAMYALQATVLGDPIPDGLKSLIIERLKNSKVSKVDNYLGPVLNNVLNAVCRSLLIRIYEDLKSFRKSALGALDVLEHSINYFHKINIKRFETASILLGNLHGEKLYILKGGLDNLQATESYSRLLEAIDFVIREKHKKDIDNQLMSLFLISLYERMLELHFHKITLREDDEPYLPSFDIRKIETYILKSSVSMINLRLLCLYSRYLLNEDASYFYKLKPCIENYLELTSGQDSFKEIRKELLCYLFFETYNLPFEDTSLYFRSLLALYNNDGGISLIDEFYKNAFKLNSSKAIQQALFYAENIYLAFFHSKLAHPAVMIQLVHTLYQDRKGYTIQEIQKYSREDLSLSDIAITLFTKMGLLISSPKDIPAKHEVLAHDLTELSLTVEPEMTTTSALVALALKSAKPTIHFNFIDPDDIELDELKRLILTTKRGDILFVKDGSVDKGWDRVYELLHITFLNKKDKKRLSYPYGNNNLSGRVLFAQAILNSCLLEFKNRYIAGVYLVKPLIWLRGLIQKIGDRHQVLSVFYAQHSTDQYNTILKRNQVKK